MALEKDLRLLIEANLAIYEDEAIFSNAETDDMKEMLEMGASGFVRKPYTFEELGKAVYDELA